MMRIVILSALMGGMIACSACSPCPPDPAGTGGADAADAGAMELVCDEHPELASVESRPCVVDADCPVYTACVTIICGSGGMCVFGASPPNGTACEQGGVCNDRRCCH